VKLKHLLEINSLDSTSFDTEIDWQVEVVSILNDLDPEEIYEWPLDRLEVAYIKFKEDLERKHSPVECLEFPEFKLHALPFNSITLGAYIDLEVYSSKADSIAKGLSILYRKKINEGDQLHPPEFEKYGMWVNHRQKIFLDSELISIMGRWDEWIEYRKNLMERYQGLFDNYQGEDPEDESALTKAQLEKIKREEAQQKAFSWEKTILSLCNSDASRFNYILNLPVIMVLNIMAAKKG